MQFWQSVLGRTCGTERACRRRGVLVRFGPGDGPADRDPGSVKEQRTVRHQLGDKRTVSRTWARVLAPEPGSAPGLDSVLEDLAADPDDVRRFGDASRMCPRASGKFLISLFVSESKLQVRITAGLNPDYEGLTTSPPRRSGHCPPRTRSPRTEVDSPTASSPGKPETT